MFRTLISNQFKNAAQFTNQSTGITVANYINKSWTGTKRINKYVYDPNKVLTTFMTQYHKQMMLGKPTIIDISHIGIADNRGRLAIEQILQTFHYTTHYGSQATFMQYWPQFNPQSATRQQIEKNSNLPFTQNRYGKPELLKLIQFIPVWAHPYTTNWNEWNELLNTSKEIYKNISSNHPLYADISITYHEINKQLKNNIVDHEQFSWMLQRISQAGYDGVIIRDQYETILPIKYFETLTATINQLNEA